MNRIKIQPKTPSQSSEYRIEQGVIRRSRVASGEYSVFVPLSYEQNYSYPLIIWLHDQSSDHRQIQRIMPLISMQNYVAISPTLGVPAKSNGGLTPILSGVGSTDSAEKSIRESIEKTASKYNIHRDRIFIAGSGTGGTMALRIGLQNPETFAGVLSLGGVFPTNHAPLSNLPDARHLPLFFAHGRDSVVYPVDDLCSHLRLLHCGGFSVTLRQYPCGDSLTQRMLSDMNRWIMEQVTGQPNDPPESDELLFGEEN